MPTKGERERQNEAVREREGKTRSGGAHSSFALPIPRPSTQAPPFLCCPIQICCNEYFAEDVNRFLDGGCRSSSVFGLPSSHGVFSLAPFPYPQSPIPHRIPILRRIIIFIMCMQSAVCSESSAFFCSSARHWRLIRQLFEALRALLLFV